MDDELTRAQRFASDVLDEMDKPKSPEREAYEAHKDREDRDALERMYIATGQYEPTKLFTKLLAMMAETIERLNPPDGEFLFKPRPPLTKIFRSRWVHALTAKVRLSVASMWVKHWSSYPRLRMQHKAASA